MKYTHKKILVRRTLTTNFFHVTRERMEKKVLTVQRQSFFFPSEECIGIRIVTRHKTSLLFRCLLICFFRFFFFFLFSWETSMVWYYCETITITTKLSFIKISVIKISGVLLNRIRKSDDIVLRDFTHRKFVVFKERVSRSWTFRF